MVRSTQGGQRLLAGSVVRGEGKGLPRLRPPPRAALLGLPSALAARIAVTGTLRMANRLEARRASPVGRLLRGPLLALVAVAAAAPVLLRANSAVLLLVYLGLSLRLRAV